MTGFLVVNNGDSVLHIHTIDNKAQVAVSTEVLDPGCLIHRVVDPGKTCVLIEAIKTNPKALN